MLPCGTKKSSDAEPKAATIPRTTKVIWGALLAVELLLIAWAATKFIPTDRMPTWLQALPNALTKNAAIGMIGMSGLAFVVHSYICYKVAKVTPDEQTALRIKLFWAAFAAVELFVIGWAASKFMPASWQVIPNPLSRDDALVALGVASLALVIHSYCTYKALNDEPPKTSIMIKSRRGANK